jgi:2-polyprenyl-3-methyl-5-hydroxy-6-metoxy-1,4-benzoquinol methylase
MSAKIPGVDFPELAGESRRIWETNARWWDARIGDGNDWHNRLIAPAVLRLLDLQSGELVADLACGNGLLARSMAQQGARVLACDFSREFLECARSRNAGGRHIEYRLMDLADPAALEALGAAQLDAAVCNMALMDMASITPLLEASRRALRPGGRFVFSILHPCFNTSGTQLIAERDDTLGVVSYAVRVSRYLGLAPETGIGIHGQPEPHYYFHRPLSALFSAFFAAGFVLDGFEEPATDAVPKSAAPLSWDNYTEIPPILAARLR